MVPEFLHLFIYLFILFWYIQNNYAATTNQNNTVPLIYYEDDKSN